MSKPSLAENHPELAKEWHPTKNWELTPDDVTPGSNKKVWWKYELADDHELEANVVSRSMGAGCPVCRGLKVVNSNCLATSNPDLAKEWHPTKNGELTHSDVTKCTSKKVWWKCDAADDYEWETSIVHRSNGLGCPCYSNKKVVLSNCLQTTHPKIAKTWHPTKNKKRTPLNVTFGPNVFTNKNINMMTNFFINQLS